MNQSLVDRLERTENIGNIYYKNLTEHGDPIYPGMSDAEVMKAGPGLAYDMYFREEGSSHFYYSGENKAGASRRNALAKEIKSLGLE